MELKESKKFVAFDLYNNVLYFNNGIWIVN